LSKSDRHTEQRAAIDAGAKTPSISTGGGAPTARRPRTADAQIAYGLRINAIIFPDFGFCACHSSERMGDTRDLRQFFEWFVGWV